MRKGTTYVGLDVHKQTISVAVAEEEGEVRELGVIANTPEAVRKLLKRLGVGASWCARMRRGRVGTPCTGG